MNHHTQINSKFVTPLFMAVAVFFFSLNVSAQKEYTTILKNINPEAQNLYHDLSPQGDTLYLGAESIFYKVTFLNSLDRKVYKFNPPVLEAKVPLHDIIVGDYTVLVYKKDRIIVFHIKRLLEIEKPINNLPLELQNIEDSLITQSTPATISNNEVVISEIAIEEILENDVTTLAMNHVSNNVKPYNLSSMDRNGMQTREDYRRNHLRPNGKPY